MSIRTFFKLVEIKTKIASVFPFSIGLLFVIYRYNEFNLTNTIIFFCSMLLIDFTTTAINNYMDYCKASSDSYRNTKNIIGQKQIPEPLIKATILVLLLAAIGLGIWLVVRTDLIVLMLGICCFIIGIFYTFGPIPLSRLPLGEVFSGLTMGFGIVFLIVYVNAPEIGIASLVWQQWSINFALNLQLILEIILISLPCVFTIANLMLANNICDLEEDIANNRFTLPYFIGKKNAIILFDSIYFTTFLSIILTVLFGLLPKFVLISLLVFIPVFNHIRQFNRKQVKSETFPLAIKNLVIVNGALVTMLILTIVF